MKFKQVGWLHPESRRFCYTDEKELMPSRSDYSIPVFIGDYQQLSEKAERLEKRERKYYTLLKKLWDKREIVDSESIIWKTEFSYDTEQEFEEIFGIG